MFHRSIARAAGAVILGAGLLLGGGSPALADETDTGPNSAACAEATATRDFHQDRVDQRQRQADKFEQRALEHDANAEEADQRATNKQAAAEQADHRAASRDAAAAEADERAAAKQQAAEEADQRAADKQAAAAAAESNGNLERRDQYRDEAAASRENRDKYRDEATASRANRNQYRLEAAQSRENRALYREQAADARAERDAERKAVAENRAKQDKRLMQRDRQADKRDAVDMSVCAEPGVKTPPDGEPEFADKDCADLSREQAQDLLEQDASDPHRLDADNDGQACEAGGGQEDTKPCANAGTVSDNGEWAWNCEKWIPVSHDTDDGAAQKAGVETGEGDLAYTGANAFSWLAGGLGLAGAGALAMAAAPRLRRN